MAAAANHILQSVGEKAKKLHVSCATMHVKGRHPAEGIIETAQAQTCDLIVIVSHGRRGARDTAHRQPGQQGCNS